MKPERGPQTMFLSNLIRNLVVLALVASKAPEGHFLRYFLMYLFEVFVEVFFAVFFGVFFCSPSTVGSVAAIPEPRAAPTQAPAPSPAPAQAPAPGAREPAS